MLRYIPPVVAALLAPAADAPAFNTDIVHTALVYVAATVIMATGIAIMIKYGRRGEVGEATNSMVVILIGVSCVVGAGTIMVFGEIISNATTR